MMTSSTTLSNFRFLFDFQQDNTKQRLIQASGGLGWQGRLWANKPAPSRSETRECRVSGMCRDHQHPPSHQVLSPNKLRSHWVSCCVKLESLIFRAFSTSQWRTRNGVRVVKVIFFFLKSFGYWGGGCDWLLIAFAQFFKSVCSILASLTCNSSLHIRDTTYFSVVYILYIYFECYLSLRLFTTLSLPPNCLVHMCVWVCLW